MRTIKSGLDYLCVLFVLLQCNTCIDHNVNSPQNNALITILAVAFAALSIVLNKGIRITRKLCYFILSYLGTMIFWCICNRNFVDDGFLVVHIVAFVSYFLLFTTVNYYGFLEKLSNVMYLLSILSLFFFLFASNLHLISPTHRILINWGTQRYVNCYFNLYCECQSMTFFSFSGFRNTGIFVEGLMFVYPLIFALYYEWFLREKGFRRNRIAVFIITILTTLSATAVILLAVLFAMKVYNSSHAKSISRYILFPIVTIIGAVIISYVIEDKYVNNLRSISSHVDDLRAALSCFVHNPILGVGYTNLSEELIDYRMVLRSNAGMSTGLGAILASGGVLWGIWFVVPSVLAMIQYFNSPKRRDRMGFIIIAFLLLLFIVVYSRLLAVMINAMCWHEILNKEEL